MHQQHALVEQPDVAGVGGEVQMLDQSAGLRVMGVVGRRRAAGTGAGHGVSGKWILVLAKIGV
jgi:hypothetical protein